MENNGLSEFITMEHAFMGAQDAANALKILLERMTPDAVIAAHDHQLPAILDLLHTRSLKIPVIGCDGLRMDKLPSKRHMVKIPLHECGEAAARQLITAIIRKQKPVSFVLPSAFV